METVGEIVWHYRILEKTWQRQHGGGHKAEDTRMGRAVALKFLPEEFSDDNAALERFQREALASALHHPNISTLYEVSLRKFGLSMCRRRLRL